MANWPWPRAINPHHEQVSAASGSWVRGFEAFNPQAQYASDLGNFGLLAALACPFVSKAHLRTECDLVYVLYVFDDYTDAEPESVVREMAAVVMDALQHSFEPRPSEEILLGELARQFWARAIPGINALSQQRFVSAMSDYADAVIAQAADRAHFKPRTIEEYLCIPEVLENEIVTEVFFHTTTLVIIDNDLASFNKEQASCDEDWNLIYVIMRNLDVSFDDAMKRAVDLHTEAEAKFIAASHDIPSFGSDELDAKVQLFVTGLATWPRGNDCWNFESERYHGKKGKEYRKTRMVPLLPKIPELIRRGSRQRDVIIPVVDELQRTMSIEAN
ncbi:hypothetical protein EIP91_006968 [Steccherinum ochraceum]|uniref:Terpene synthase n=1 Tax=Steccherinum ochraceum TaxID=92696 RepID=A0A4R0R7D5_9APHY|nr:hypothetical protein EIP91_006968 [Steccherinum ochraceum]